MRAHHPHPIQTADQAALTATVNAAVRAATADVHSYVRQGLHLLGLFHADLLPSQDELRLALALHVARIRDIALAAITPGNAPERAAAWSRLAGRTEPTFAAPACALAAAGAFLAGDTESGSAALETALACDPNYRVAHLMQGMLRVGAEPAQFDVSNEPLPYRIRPRRYWVTPLLDRAKQYLATTAPHPALRSVNRLDEVDARAAVARAARDSGLAIQFANADAAHYESGDKTLTITYTRDGRVDRAFYIQARALPGQPLNSLADVIAALREMTTRPIR